MYSFENNEITKNGKAIPIEEVVATLNRVKELKIEKHTILRRTGCFKGVVEGDPLEKMIAWWMENEGATRDEAIMHYYNYESHHLASRLSEPCWFIPDGKDTCFELEDYNFLLPQKLIKRL